MLCVQCNENPATFFFNQVIKGELTQRNLCESCALPLLRQLPPARWTSYDPTVEPSSEDSSRPADCPASVTITDPVTVHTLASALGIEFFDVIRVPIMQHDIYKSSENTLDFATASLVCAYYGVTPHKAS